jgi:hypothetical protein
MINTTNKFTLHGLSYKVQTIFFLFQIERRCALFRTDCVHLNANKWCTARKLDELKLIICRILYNNCY